MTTAKGSGQGSGGKGLLITAVTAGTAQTLHTAVTGTATSPLFRYMLVNNSDAGVQVNLRFEPSDASDPVEIQELVPAQSAVFTPIPDTLGLPLNDAMVVKIYAATASVVTAWAGITTETANQNGATQKIQSGEVTLVQNTDAFRTNGVASSATEADHQIMMPVAGVLKNFRGRASANIGGGATVTAVVRVNGADTALTFSYAVADTTTLKSDTTNQVAVAAGDLVTINCATDNAGAPASTMYCAVEFDPA